MKRFGLLVAAFVAWAGSSSAQTDFGPLGPPSNELARARANALEQPTPVVLAGTVDPNEYVVGPGDVLQLNLSGRVTRTLWLTVSPEGVIFVPGAGAVVLRDLTLAQAQREVERRLSTQFFGVRIDTRLASVRTMRVFTTGEVNVAGGTEVLAVSRVSDVLPEALFRPGASRRNIAIARRGGTRLIADLERWTRTGNNAFNPLVRDGDVLNVPVATTHVEIQGAVARPGATELGPSDSLSTLFELSGGVRPSARRDRCLMVRWKSATEAESLLFTMEQVASGEFNPPLRDGDRVYVYDTPRFHELEQAVVVGEVERPGTYPLVSGKTRLSDLIEAAGGFLPRASLSAIRVYRPNAAVRDTDPELDRLLRLSRAEMSEVEYSRLQTRLAARHQDFRIDWRRIRGVPELDLVMRGGDIVRVEQEFLSVRVDGEVRRPGIVSFEPTRDANDYIRLVGGFSERAAPGKVLVTRAVTGQTLRSRDVQALAPGDLIWVPERPDRSIWQELAVVLAAGAQFATIYIAFRR